MTEEAAVDVRIGTDPIPPSTKIENLTYRNPGWNSNTVRFPVATVSSLAELGVTTVRDLSAVTEEDLWGVEQLGEVRLGWLQKAARLAGVRFPVGSAEPSVLLRVDGEAAERLVQFADEVGLTASELANAVLTERMDQVTEWASAYVATCLLEQAKALTERANKINGR